jgi:DNA-binding NtrC family response regulator
MTTICGHELGTLQWALSTFDPDDGLPSCGCESAKCQAQLVVDDPAKLAELLAEALRERGVDVPGPSEQTFWAQLVIQPRRTEGVIEIDMPEDGPSFTLDMPQARAALLRVLSLPEGATAEDAVKAVSQ